MVLQQDGAPADLDGVVVPTSHWRAGTMLITRVRMSLTKLHTKGGRASLVCGWFRRIEAANENQVAACENVGPTQRCHAPKWSTIPSRYILEH